MRAVDERRGERAQATLETALAMPVILFTLLAVILFGLYLQAHMVVTLAASQGARLGAVLYGDPAMVPTDATARVEAHMRSVLSGGLSLTPNNHTVSAEVVPDDRYGQQFVRTVVTYHFAVFLPLLQESFAGRPSVTIRYSSVYRVERQ